METRWPSAKPQVRAGGTCSRFTGDVWEGVTGNMTPLTRHDEGDPPLHRRKRWAVGGPYIEGPTVVTATTGSGWWANPTPGADASTDEFDELLDILDVFRTADIGFGLERPASRPVLVFDRPLPSVLAALVEPYRVALTLVALGRYSGHAPARCDRCGEVTMLSIVNSSGTRRGAPSVGWPRCSSTPRCKGRRIIRDVDREGVRRISSKRAKRAPRPLT